MKTQRLCILLICIIAGGLSAAVFAQSAGSLDASFRVTDKLERYGWEPRAVQADGKLLLVRDPFPLIRDRQDDPQVALDQILARLDGKGELDSGFRPASLLYERTPQLTHDGPITAVQPDGKILVGSRVGKLLVEGAEVVLARLQPDGSLDTSFTPPSPFDLTLEQKAARGIPADNILIQPDGRIYLGLLRLLPDGGIDPDFNPPLPDDLFGSYTWYRTALQSTGRLLVARSGNWLDVPGLLRLLPDGSQDPSFRTVRPGAVIDQVEVTADARVLLRGGFTAVGGGTRPGLALLLSDGVLDNTFAPFKTDWARIEVRSVAAQPDGKIIAAGEFLRRGAKEPLLIVRLNTDGTLDESFVAEVRPLRYAANEIEKLFVSSILLQPDQKILAGIHYEVKSRNFFFSQSEMIRLHGDPFTLRMQTPLHRPDGSVQIGIAAASNTTFVLEAASSLSPPNWLTLSTNTITTGPLTVTDPDAAKFPQRFYRAVVR